MSVNLDIIKQSIDFYRKDTQTTVCMEECAELIQAISKEKRGKHDKQHLIEEIADVYICLEMLMEIYNISSKEIESMIERKQQRERDNAIKPSEMVNVLDEIEYDCSKCGNEIYTIYDYCPTCGKKIDWSEIKK